MRLSDTSEDLNPPIGRSGPTVSVATVLHMETTVTDIDVFVRFKPPAGRIT